MEIGMKEDGKGIKKMVMESIGMRVSMKGMKGNGRMEKSAVMECISILIMIATRVNGEPIRKMEKGLYIIQAEPDMRVNGWMILLRDIALCSMIIGINMKGNEEKVKRRERESIFLSMDQYMKASGHLMINVEKVL